VGITFTIIQAMPIYQIGTVSWLRPDKPPRCVQDRQSFTNHARVAPMYALLTDHYSRRGIYRARPFYSGWRSQTSPLPTVGKSLTSTDRWIKFRGVGIGEDSFFPEKFPI